MRLPNDLVNWITWVPIIPTKMGWIPTSPTDAGNFLPLDENAVAEETQDAAQRLGKIKHEKKSKEDWMPVVA